MRYKDFEKVMSQARMSRYLNAVGNDTRKTMTLYRLNLRLSQELFTIVSCFEISLRNAVNDHYLLIHGANWLRDGAKVGGIFDTNDSKATKRVINDSIRSLNNGYTHAKLVASLGFGFWRYMFARHQYRVGGQSLITIFTNKPASTPVRQYNSNYIFGELKKVNDLRNRLAHHEPVCFRNGHALVDTTSAQNHYQLILTLFNWLGIDEKKMLYGLDHVDEIINKIDNL